MILIEQNPRWPGQVEGQTLINGEDIAKRSPLSSKERQQRLVAARAQRRRRGRKLKAAAVLGTAVYLSKPERRAKAKDYLISAAPEAHKAAGILVDMHRHREIYGAIDAGKEVYDIVRPVQAVRGTALVSGLRAGTRNLRGSYRARRHPE